MVNEKILCVPKNILKNVLKIEDGFKEYTRGEELEKIIEKEGVYIPRSEAEKSEEYVQLIPCGVLQHNNKILLLKRKEVDRTKRLHEKYVIWAGGHVREEDNISKNPLEDGLKRELEEELFIKTQFSVEGPIGFVYSTIDPKSSRHLGIVFKISLASQSVMLDPKQSEFEERKGKSLSCTFQQLNMLKKYYSKMECWSRYILEKYYKIS